MKNKELWIGGIIVLMLVIIAVSYTPKQITQPNVSNNNTSNQGDPTLESDLDIIYNGFGVHLDQITKYDDDKYGISFTEKEICNKKFHVLEQDSKIDAYCSAHATMMLTKIYFINTKQMCINNIVVKIQGVSIENQDGMCDNSMSYYGKDTPDGLIMHMIKTDKKYIDNYQNNKVENIPTLLENGLYNGANPNSFVVEYIQNNWNQHKDFPYVAKYDYKTYISGKITGGYITVGCFKSISEMTGEEGVGIDKFVKLGFRLTDISYAGLYSDTYVKDDMTVTFVTMKNCLINIAILPETQDYLNAEIKYLQQINNN